MGSRSSLAVTIVNASNSRLLVELVRAPLAAGDAVEERPGGHRAAGEATAAEAHAA